LPSANACKLSVQSFKWFYLAEAVLLTKYYMSNTRYMLKQSILQFAENSKDPIERPAAFRKPASEP